MSATHQKAPPSRRVSLAAGLPTRKRSKARRTSVVLERLEKKRASTLSDLAKDSGIKAWRVEADTQRLHAIQQDEKREIERLEAVEEAEAAGAKVKNQPSSNLAHLASLQLTTRSIEMSSLPVGSKNALAANSMNPMHTKNVTPVTETKTTASPKSKLQGIAKFKKAVRKVQIQNVLKRTFSVKEKRRLSLEHHFTERHCHKSVGSLKIFFHFLCLLFVYLASTALWTYDGLDATEMIESQIFSDSKYNHFASKFTDVDSHTSFNEFVPTLLDKLFTMPLAPSVGSEKEKRPRPILRYKKSNEQEEVCAQYHNGSFPMYKSDGRSNAQSDVTPEYSSTYKVFRPLSNTGTSVGMRKKGSVYLSDGLLIRSLRGKVQKGKFTPSMEPSHCGSNYFNNRDLLEDRVFSSGAWGTYMKFPTDQGYDLLFSGEEPHAAVRKTYNDSFLCGWVDQDTRAVVFAFTLAYFSDLSRLDQTENTVRDASTSTSAYGTAIEVSVKLVFDMPGNGLIRTSYEFVVLDKTDNVLKWTALIALAVLNFLLLIFHITDMIHIGFKRYSAQWMHALQLLSLSLFSVSFGAILWSDQRSKFWQFDPSKAATDPQYALYRCSKKYLIEENAEKTVARLFFIFFSWYGVFEVWLVLHYLRVFPVIMIPLTALTSSALEILFFFMVFFVLVLGFSVGSHLSFGDVFEFRSIMHSLVTLLLVSVDELDSIDLFTGTQHVFYGQAFMYLFRMLASVIFLNIFIVIVLVQYEIARSERRFIVDEMHSLIFLWGRRFAMLYGCCRTCCSREKSEVYVTRWRKFYYDFREGKGQETQYPPLRHDTEVLMGELYKLKGGLTKVDNLEKKIDALMEKMEKLNKKGIR